MSTTARWIRPRSLQEALEARRDLKARPLAGATDLYVRYRGATGTIPPVGDAPILYLGGLEELTTITTEGDRLRIGAAAVYTDIYHHRATPEPLRQAIRELAAPALRNVATMGGNIGNASPAADAVCPLYALHAEVELRDTSGSRCVPIGDVLTGPGRTTIGDTELITAILIPISLPGGEGHHTVPFHAYRKVGTRRANALSKVAFAAAGTVQEGRIADVGIAIGAVGPTVVHAPQVEALLRGLNGAEYAKHQPGLTKLYMDRISPISDQRSTDLYRRRVTENLLNDLFHRVIPAALGGTR